MPPLKKTDAKAAQRARNREATSLAQSGSQAAHAAVAAVQAAVAEPDIETSLVDLERAENYIHRARSAWRDYSETP